MSLHYEKYKHVYKKYRETHREQINKESNERYHRNPQKHYEYKLRIRRKALELCGNKCSKCGYNRCMSALEFHHLNPEEKESSHETFCRRIFKLIKEKKVILLCANCHREEHSKNTD